MGPGPDHWVPRSLELLSVALRMRPSLSQGPMPPHGSTAANLGHKVSFGPKAGQSGPWHVLPTPEENPMEVTAARTSIRTGNSPPPPLHFRRQHASTRPPRTEPGLGSNVVGRGAGPWASMMVDLPWGWAISSAVALRSEA